MTRKRSTCNNNGYSVTKLKYKFAEFVLKEAYWGTVKEPVLPAMFTSVRVARNIRKHSGGHAGKDFRYRVNRMGNLGIPRHPQLIERKQAEVLGISFCMIELWGVLSDERGVSGVSDSGDCDANQSA
ncbi:conserved hypothetical protein [Histoplasma capsulatum var. duboisii H88]|uniref:Uncharacterized protein n=2 Tax=Ajellomyces capsulatus TaxID=5037 RepID=F0ULH1_AJEC8|nr:conserved hypothetical protein [Histoplasma capsulatum H143]EGC46241.1 conserved hypothetical protein [Histoplasma capsulatum var. duboisii H88]